MRDKLLLYIIARVAGGIRVIRVRKETKFYLREKEKRESELLAYLMWFAGNSILVAETSLHFRQEIRGPISRRNSWAAKQTPHKSSFGFPAHVHVSSAMTEALTQEILPAT